MATLRNSMLNTMYHQDQRIHFLIQSDAEMIGAGASMATHNNCIYVFGGMDEERAEHMHMWRWNLNNDVGFEIVTMRYATPMRGLHLAM